MTSRTRYEPQGPLNAMEQWNGTALPENGVIYFQFMTFFCLSRQPSRQGWHF